MSFAIVNSIIDIFFVKLFLYVADPRKNLALSKISLKTKKILSKTLKIINNKTTSIQFSRFQYNHALDYIFSVSNNTTIVEIGAMDGKSFDKLYPYLKSKSNITAILVEPLLNYFIQLKENYKGSENNFIYVNAAITEMKGEVEISHIPLSTIELNSLPDWTRGVSSLTPEKNCLLKESEKHFEGRNVSQFIVKEKVKSDTLSNILDNYLINYVDILQIDTEGYDYIVLGQALKIIKPKLICFEWVNLTEDEKLQSFKLLRDNGYTPSLSLDSEDMIACKREFFSQLNKYLYVNYSVFLLPY